ncbi:MAG TPA: ATP synthase F1 subunit delta [Planctomycetota bacterium]
MIDRTLAKRYAAALLKVTDADGSTEEVEALLLALRDAWRVQRGFRDMMVSPKVPRAVKKSMLRKSLAGKAKESLFQFLDLLVDKNRAVILPEVADMFDRLADASHGVVRVKVRSWKPLSDVQSATLSEKLVKITGKKIQIEAETDPALKGGIQLRIGDSVVDGTVAHRLQALGEKFRELERR